MKALTYLVGEMGISNTTASALMTAKFAGLTAEEATGRGTNISDERLKLKQRIVHDVLEKYKDIPKRRCYWYFILCRWF